MRTAILLIAAALSLAGASAAAPSFEGYTFPLAHFKPGGDATAHGDVHLVIQFDKNDTASLCWQFGVFTRDRTRYVYLRKASAGEQGPIVDTFDLHPRVVGWDKLPWSGSTGFNGCRGVRSSVAHAMVRAPRSFYLDARSVRSRHAARAQLRGPAKRCLSVANCG